MYRIGDDARAIKVLESVAAGLRVDGGTATKAYLALANHRSGNLDQGHKLYDEAQASFRDAFIRPNPELYQADWIAAAIVEQAVKEAGQVIGAEKKAGP